MAVLKYKNSEGNYVTIPNYTVSSISPVQTTGTSTTDVMSQKAVTDEINRIDTAIGAIQIPDVTNFVTSGAVESQINSKGYQTSEQVDAAITSKDYTTLALVKADETIKSATDEAAFNNGHSTTTSDTIPVTKRLCIATWSTNVNITSPAVPDGKEIHIICKNTHATNDITVTIPNADPNIVGGDNSITIKAGKFGEINIVSDGTNRYWRAIV